MEYPAKGNNNSKNKYYPEQKYLFPCQFNNQIFVCYTSEIGLFFAYLDI